VSAKVIDLFAGAGGFSTGAKMSGCDVVWAANHWPTAVKWHAANHPETEHACQDLQQADWRDVPAHDIMAASPACQGHSRARGKEMPHHDALRSTAWAVVACAEYHRSPIVVVENVPDFSKWVLYPAWLDAMQRLGYSVSPHFIDSADHGVPQNRDRLFLVATRSKAPLQLQLPRRPHVPVRDVIEWDRYAWNPVHTPRRSPNTLRRIAAGRATFGDRFAAPFYGSGSGLTGRSLDRPLGTLTTIDRWAIVDGDRMRMLKISEAKAVMGFPADYDLPPTQREAMHLLGNAVCPPVARDVFTAILEAA
jgi:DNA (cytosine-5)-methyltransferase 1